MDEGDILAQTKVSLKGTETAESLLNYSATEGAELILGIIKECNENKKLPQGCPQTGEASYTGIITKEDGRINWNDNAAAIEAKIRAYYPDPGCWCMENNAPLKILEAGLYKENEAPQNAEAVPGQNPAATPGTVLEFSKSDGILIKTGNGILAVKKLQRQGKNAMDYKSFMNGARNFIGTVLE